MTTLHDRHHKKEPPSYTGSDQHQAPTTQRLAAHGYRFNDIIEIETFMLFEQRHYDIEVISMLCMDDDYYFRGYDELFSGTADCCVTFTPIIAECAMSHNASKIVLAHNQPWGTPQLILHDNEWV